MKQHYTDEVFTFEQGRTYQQRGPMGHLKPNGLWVSVAGDDDWPSWCRDQEFRMGALGHLAMVTLTEDANVLVVSTPEQLDEFHEEFAVDDDPAFNERMTTGLLRELPGFSPKRFWAMDWPTVAGKFDGIIITPYLWSRRLDGPSWYYGWDCASGCVWNLSAVDAVEVVM